MAVRDVGLKVCVVIPAYNEEKTIGSVVKNVVDRFNESLFSATIVVVDDGSKDKTVQEAQNQNAIVIRHIMNTGAGGATATGLSYAEQQGYEVAVTMDADGQHAVDDIYRGIEELIKTNTDLLIGSRLINSEGMSRVKIFGNKGLSLVTFLLFGIKSTDSQSGLRVFSRRALEQLRWKTSGYEFCSEMLWRAKQLDLSMGEFPIKAIYTEYSKAKGQNNWNGFNIVSSLIRRRVSELLHE